MTFLPIVERELRTRARQGVTYWTRCAMAAAAALIALESTISLAKAASPAAMGAASFQTLAWMALGLAVAAVLVTADTISGERREGTLGLLFLTDLAPYDVVLGKLAAAGVTAFYTLVGFVPALALTILCGGVTAGRLGHTALALLNSIFVALCAGLWASAGSQTSQGATRRAAVAMGTLLFWALVLHGVYVFGSFSPFSAFFLALDGSYAAKPALYWVAIVAGHLTGWLFLKECGFLVRQNWRTIERYEPPPPTKPRKTPGRSKAGWHEQGRELLEKSPVCWVASRMPGKPALVLAAVLLMLASLVFRGAVAPVAFGIWNGFNLLFTLGSAAIFAWLSGRFFFEARRTGELELLLSTPMGARDIIQGYWWALWGNIRLPLLLAAFITFASYLFFMGARGGQLGTARGLDVLAVAIVPANTVLDVVAVCWVGLWYGLQARKPFLVVAWTVGMVIGLPWLVSYLLIVLFGGVGAPGRALSVLYSWLTISPALYLAKNIFFIRWAAYKLRQELRTGAPLAVGEWLE